VSGQANGLACSLTLTDEALQLIADRAAAIVLASGDSAGGWPEWMGVGTAARYLDMSIERVRKLKDRGVLPCYQEAPGCRVFFRRVDLDAAMAFGRVP
jgi:hypothetical protein